MTIGMQDDTAWVATTFENCRSVAGPFYHGTAAELEPGDLLVPGFGSNYEKGRISNHVYFSTMVASLAAQMAAALTGVQGRGHVYIVEPTGPFEDDPNVTNKRFRGNPTKSYRSRHPLRIVAELDDWEEHGPDVITGMLDRLAALREQGLNLIED
jgi:rifampin ADP-ribosylating transferase